MSSVSFDPGWSPSVGRALLWASGCAALRGERAQVGSDDLFVGLLLVHADREGEAWRFLDHFGLTARDLLADDYPIIDPPTLLRVAAGASNPDPGHWDPELSGFLSEAVSLAGGTAQVMHMLAVLLRSIPWQNRLGPPLARLGVSANALTEQLVNDAVRSMDLTSSKPAGTQLGDWLEQRFPRAPTTMASFSNDVPDPGADFVGVDEEADAFAYLIGSRSLVPPLAIGLFGDWGSGKSFLMAKIRQRVGQLTALAAGDARAQEIWPNVASIEFNAWQYVETDLWAALLTRIFDELSPEARIRLTELGRRQQVMRAKKDANLGEQLKIEKGLGKLRIAEANEEKAVTEAAAHTSLVREHAAELEVVAVRGALESHARSAVAAGVVGGVLELSEEAKTVVREAQRLQATVRDPVWRQKEYWTWWRVVWVVGALVILPVFALMLDNWGFAPLTAVTAGITAMAVALTPMIKFATAFAEGQRKAAREASEEAKTQLDSAVETAERTQREKQDALAAIREKIASEQRKAQVLATDRIDLEKMADRLNVGTAYADFLAGRTSTADYRKRLGLISTVSDDLRTLSELVAEYNASSEAHTASGPPNRIVLYIDDLDRCPPHRVLEVLEAVHLLLAFPLFVVVVAVDTRWLTSALHDALPLLEKQAKPGVAAPTATDYLEKIFQIPFWVEPLNEAARRRLLRGVLLPSVRVSEGHPVTATAPLLEAGEREMTAARVMLAVHGISLDRDARPFTITPEELAFIETLNPLLTGTPRQVKRFVNICKLLLAMSPPLAGGTTMATERTAACFMAALHQSMPAFASGLAQACIEATGSMTLKSLVPRVRGGGLDVDRERVLRWLSGEPRAASQPERPHHGPFGEVSAQMLLKRWGVIERLRFAEDESDVIYSAPVP